MEIVFLEQLKQAGLTPHQASLYETLLKMGFSTARTATREAAVPRTLGYAVLEQLIELGLVFKDDSPVAKFSAAHPNVLQERIESAAKSAERASIALKSVLPELSSVFNLATGKPGVQFFEGPVGVREALFDSLTSSEQIYTFTDTDTVEGYFREINDEYVHKRLKKGVSKKLLMIDSPTARAELLSEQSPHTEIRLVSAADAPAIHAAISIYDGKVMYLTFTKDILTGTIIHDAAIYRLHRFLFEQQWKNALTKESL